MFAVRENELQSILPIRPIVCLMDVVLEIILTYTVSGKKEPIVF